MDSQKSVTLHPFGDVELWYAEPADKTWQLPLWVRWHKQKDSETVYGLISPGVTFYQNQKLHIQALLRADSLEDRNDRWLLTMDRIGTLLFKAAGVTPTFYYRWSPDQPAMPHNFRPLQVQTEPPPGPTSERYKHLAEFIADERKLPADVVTVVLTALAAVAPKWMLTERNVLDLGFCRLVAVPFRANWKQIIAFKCRKWSMIGLMAMSRYPRRRALKQIGFEEVISSPHNIGMVSMLTANRVDYTIEAIPAKSFEAEANVADSVRLRAGHTAYIAHYEETVELLYDEICDALCSYFRKVAKPFAQVSRCGAPSLISFAPVKHGRKPHVDKLCLDDLPVHIVPPTSGFSVFAKQSDPRLVSLPPIAMQEVPAVLPTTRHMRKREVRGDVAEPRPNGTAGLPVQDGSEGADPGETVLPGDSISGGDTSRMDQA